MANNAVVASGNTRLMRLVEEIIHGATNASVIKVGGIEELVRAVADAQPLLVIIDDRLGETEGTGLIAVQGAVKEVRALHPGAAVYVMQGGLTPTLTKGIVCDAGATDYIGDKALAAEIETRALDHLFYR